MEYILYYLFGIVITFILITIGLVISKSDYEEETVGMTLVASIGFPITLIIVIGSVICLLLDELFKRILK